MTAYEYSIISKHQTYEYALTADVKGEQHNTTRHNTEQQTNVTMKDNIMQYNIYLSLPLSPLRRVTQLAARSNDSPALD